MAVRFGVKAQQHAADVEVANHLTQSGEHFGHGVTAAARTVDDDPDGNARAIGFGDGDHTLWVL